VRDRNRERESEQDREGNRERESEQDTWRERDRESASKIEREEERARLCDRRSGTSQLASLQELLSPRDVAVCLPR